MTRITKDQPCLCVGCPHYKAAGAGAEGCELGECVLPECWRCGWCCSRDSEMLCAFGERGAGGDCMHLGIEDAGDGTRRATCRIHDEIVAHPDGQRLVQFGKGCRRLHGLFGLTRRGGPRAKKD